jgi:large subunit ribosomal protein L28
MAKVCQISGKRPSAGNNVSHSVRRTKRRFLPNLQKKRIFDPVSGRWIKVRVATSTLRTLFKEPSAHEQKIMDRKQAKRAEKQAV